MTNARVVLGSATALLLTALLGFQAGTSVPLSSRTASFLSVGRGRCERGSSLPARRSGTAETEQIGEL